MSPDDEREFRDFVAARSPALLRTAYLLTGDVHHAQDLLQSALLACMRCWTGIGHREHPEAYVRRALYRQQVNRWRWRARRPESLVAVPPDRVSGGGDPAERFAQHDSVIEALRSLPPRQRAVVVLRYYEDRSEVDVAMILDISVGTVRSQASRALAKLRSHYLDRERARALEETRP